MLCIYSIHDCQRIRAIHEAQRIQVLETSDAISRKIPSLDLQLSEEDSQTIHDNYAQLQEHLSRQDFKTAQTTLENMFKSLGLIAIAHIPQKLFDNRGEIADVPLDFFHTGELFGYLASPLAEYLPQEQRAELQTFAERNAKTLAPGNVPRLGQSFQNTSSSTPLSLAFVPPGRFRSAVTQRVESIDYPYWIFDREVTNAQYQFMLNDISSLNDQPSLTSLFLII